MQHPCFSASPWKELHNRNIARTLQFPQPCHGATLRDRDGDRAARFARTCIAGPRLPFLLCHAKASLPSLRQLLAGDHDLRGPPCSCHGGCTPPHPPEETWAQSHACLIFVAWQGSAPLRASNPWSEESVGRLGTAEEVGTHETGEAFQSLHLHRVKLPVEAAAQELPHPQRTISILEGSVDLRGHPSPDCLHAGCWGGNASSPCLGRSRSCSSQDPRPRRHGLGTSPGPTR
uniref:Uncharacterized protein n=1 Tax=Rhinopithecus roxellana TaxID=61622 RepID=A0A2K6Q065_RHIRO